MQTRLAAKRIELQKKAESNDTKELSNDITVHPSPGIEVSPPPKSKAAVVPKKRRRREAVELCQLNLDVLFLIAAYIDPVDLLNLARTCKSLRELLMGKASAFVWKIARRQVWDLPDCPDDLTEPEYANLVFCARCHSCGKHTTNVFWNIRRRYCNKCIGRRLRRLSSCQQVIQSNNVVPAERITAKNENCAWLDRGQVALFMGEYRRHPNKDQFISEKQEYCKNIRRHARECSIWYGAWKRWKASERKEELQDIRQERGNRILERLEKQGYKPEIQYFGSYTIQQKRETDFKISKPLTDKEWNRIWPDWLEIMNKLRLERWEKVVYAPRQQQLKAEYERYLQHSSPETPTFDIFPPVVELARFPPFKDVITAPEGSPMGAKPFEKAFEQLSVLVADWRGRVDTDVAEIVKIPPHLLSEGPSGRRILVSNRKKLTEPSVMDSGKLQLACAAFYTDCFGVYNYLEVLSASLLRGAYEKDWENSGSIVDRYAISFLEEAPYIIHACGLNPSVAKVDDMDRRNARLLCLCCPHDIVMDWRNAMLHAHAHHISSELTPLSKELRWKLVSDEHINVIQAVEQSAEIRRNQVSRLFQCLLCRPHVHGLWSHEITNHLRSRHEIREDVKLGVHYTALGICSSELAPPPVKMVKEGKKVTFKLL